MNSSPSISPRASNFFSSKVSPGAYSRPTIGVYEITAEKQERMERLRHEFDEIDTNRDQNLTFEEIRNFLSRKSGQEFDEVLCQELFASMDRDKDSGVTVDEFILSYVQAEELIQTRIDQLDRQITDNQQHLEEAQWKLQEAEKLERNNANGIMIGSVLTCHVREAKNLKPMNMRGKSDPYVVLTCERQRIETKYISNEVNPVWDEVFTFQIERHDSNLRVTIMDRSNLGSDEFQGMVVIPLSTIADQLKHDNYYELKAKDQKEPWPGKIRLGMQWVYSKVKYFQTIIQQWGESLEMDRQELDYLKGQLLKLDKPFGHLLEMKALKNIQNSSRASIRFEGLELQLNVKLEQALSFSFAKGLDWNWAAFLSMLVYLILSVLLMFARSDFPDVSPTQVALAAALYYLWVTKSRSSKAYKGLAVGLLLSEVYDLMWFAAVGMVSDRQGWTGAVEMGGGLRGLCLFLAVVNFIVKLPICVVVWKTAMDLGSSSETLR